ncbi:hypothetical protein BHK98_05845 [Hornefia porci]|uniref:Uncharacterized protein n=1 Tax=Hornefia porci TaxID=2652292 RepID=A0A1Q9JHD5_9FIRM|nr:hypothetical protein BHK98_05845 [Hornefia porci]
MAIDYVYFYSIEFAKLIIRYPGRNHYNSIDGNAAVICPVCVWMLSMKETDIHVYIFLAE